MYAHVCFVLIEGLRSYGDELLAKFKWGHSFYEVNEELLMLYASCKDGADVVLKQNEFLRNEKKERMNPQSNGNNSFLS